MDVLGDDGVPVVPIETYLAYLAALEPPADFPAQHADACLLAQPGGAVFSILERRLLRNGEFDNVEDLAARIIPFIHD